MRIIFLNPTQCARFCNGPLVYYRKFNQYTRTMGWYDRKETIYIVNQYNFFKNSFLVAHEFLHYLNDKIADITWVIAAVVMGFARGRK